MVKAAKQDDSVRERHRCLELDVGWLVQTNRCLRVSLLLDQGNRVAVGPVDRTFTATCQNQKGSPNSDQTEGTSRGKRIRCQTHQSLLKQVRIGGGKLTHGSHALVNNGLFR